MLWRALVLVCTYMNDVNALLMSLALDKEVREDPYPIYGEFRALGPMVRANEGFAVATNYVSSTQVLRRPEFVKGLERRDHYLATARPSRRKDFPPSMLFQDPPNHTRLRRSVSQFFLPTKLESLRERLRQIALKLFGEIRDSGQCELISSFALPLPVWVIGDILGVPSKDRLALQPDVSKIAKTLDFNFNEDDAVQKEAEESSERLITYFEELIADKVRDPKDDLLSELVSNSASLDEPLSNAESCSMAMLLFAAGFETTGNLIGNATAALCHSPSEYQNYLDGRVSTKEAVDELVRFDSPVQLDGRVVDSEVTLFDVTLPAGSFVITLLGAANRDDMIYKDPDLLSLARSGPAPLSFGSGVHFCLGSYLAKMELGIYLELLRELKASVSIKKYLRKQSLTLRGFEEMYITI